jgi:transposase InsO family protein
VTPSGWSEQVARSRTSRPVSALARGVNVSRKRCYLAAIQDLYSRAIIGWNLAGHMRSELVVDALQMAIHRRRPQAGLVHHSDQGSQYVSPAFV